MAASSTKTILVTGCNSGIGLTAAKILHNSHQHRILLVARTLEKANAAKETILSSSSSSSSSSNNDTTSSLLVPFACDMSSFRSIHDFATELHEHEAVKNGLDVLCLNAGMCTAKNSDVDYTEDDLEVTLATNHFGPFLLTHKIVDLMNAGGRIVITASGVHKGKENSSNKPGPSFGEFKGALKEDGTTTTPRRHFESLDGSEFDHYRAYAQSKLCNVAFCLELNRRLEKGGKEIIANCFCPGLMTMTGFFRNQNTIFMTIFGFMANTVLRFGDTEEWGGGALAWLAVDEAAGKKGGEYWKAPNGISRKGGRYGVDFVPTEVSPEAESEENRVMLWKISANLVGVDEDAI